MFPRLGCVLCLYANIIIFFTKYHCGENIRIKHKRKQENACWQNILPSHIDDIFSGKKIYGIRNYINIVGKTLCSYKV